MPVTTKFKSPPQQRNSDMPMIYVKTKEGRRAYYEGRVIPQDKFIPVTDTPYIRRLVNHWGDLEIEGGGEQKKPEPTAQKHVPSPTAVSAPQKTDTDNSRPPSRQAATPTQAAPNNPAPGTGAPKPHN